MNIGRILFLLSGTGLWIAACGGTTSSNGSTPVAASDFAASYAHAICDNVGPCCQQGGLAYDANACVTSVQGLIQGLLVNPANASGSKYDANAAGNCISQISAIVKSCNETSAQRTALDQACSAVYSGTKQPGDTCNSSADCAASPDGRVTCDHWATGSSDGGTQSGSTCQLRKTPKGGEPCGSTSGAPPAIVGDCSYGASDTFTCDYKTNTCVARKALGAQCTSADECVTTAFCQSGTCAAKLPLGSACDGFSKVCDDKLKCDSATQKCIAKLADGAACQGSNDCAGGRCSSGKCASSSFADPTICGGTAK